MYIYIMLLYYYFKHRIIAALMKYSVSFSDVAKQKRKNIYIYSIQLGCRHADSKPYPRVLVIVTPTNKHKQSHTHANKHAQLARPALCFRLPVQAKRRNLVFFSLHRTVLRTAYKRRISWGLSVNRTTMWSRMWLVRWVSPHRYR